jgi:hypothetical protein
VWKRRTQHPGDREPASARVAETVCCKGREVNISQTGHRHLCQEDLLTKDDGRRVLGLGGDGEERQGRHAAREDRREKGREAAGGAKRDGRPDKRDEVGERRERKQKTDDKSPADGPYYGDARRDKGVEKGGGDAVGRQDRRPCWPGARSKRVRAAQLASSLPAAISTRRPSQQTVKSSRRMTSETYYLGARSSGLP